MNHPIRTILPLMLLSTWLAAYGASDARAERFIVHGDGTVTDTSTGLMWVQAYSGNATWSAALNACESATVGGYGDWRLPNIKELHSMFDLTLSSPAFDSTAFSKHYQAGASYWSSTTRASNPVAALAIDQGTGSIFSGQSKADSGSVSYPMTYRCVR